MKKIFLVLSVLSTLGYACKTANKSSGSGLTTNGDLIIDASYRKPIRNKELFKETYESISIDTAFIVKDTLNIITRKIEGCDASDFKLIWTGDLGKTAPLQTAVKLLQYGEGNCREKHRFQLTYNVSGFKLKNDTSAAAKTTIIKVGGWAKTINYGHN